MKSQSCYRLGFPVSVAWMVVGLAASWFVLCSVHAQMPDGEVTAPPNHTSFSRTPSGLNFAPNNLMEPYLVKKAEIERLSKELDLNPRSQGLRQQLDEARQILNELTKTIQKQLVHVEPFAVHESRETQTIELGESRQVVIVGDEVVLRGWNGDFIKCVVQKIVLGEAPETGEFDQIRVVHEQRVAPDLVGVTEQAHRDSQEEFSKSPEGQNLTLEQRRARTEVVESIRASKAMYRPLQGHELTLLRVKGLTAQEGNRSLTGKVNSPEGGASWGSYWRRSAQTTIYIPACKTVAIRGCLKKVDIKSVQANLILTNHDSHDRDYEGFFEVVDVDGDVDIHQVPIRNIEGVNGDLRMINTVEFTNVFTRHAGGQRETASPPTAVTRVQNVAGAFSGRFLRTRLQLAHLRGKIDVLNEFGDTFLDVDRQPLAKAAHRILSQAGHIGVSLPDFAALDLPLFAYSEVGSVSTQGDAEKLESRHFGSNGRSWYGFESNNVNQDPFGRMKRPQDAWGNTERSVGLDLVSRAGSIQINQR